MASTADPTVLDQFPPELVQAVAHEAALDADAVGAFLDALGLGSSDHSLTRKPVCLPAAFLLGLGAALRLLRWEQSGVRAHLQQDLPAAQQAIRQLFQAVLQPQQAELELLARELTFQVFTLWLQRFAWQGRDIWNADLVLGDAEEDELVEVLAAFLWIHRNTTGQQGETG